jgi:hypothetical protein
MQEILKIMDRFTYLEEKRKEKQISKANTEKKCISQLYMKKMQRWSAIQIGIEKNLTSHLKIVRIQT